MILPINHILNRKYIRQSKQLKIEKYVIHKKSTRTEHDYRAVDRVMIRKNVYFKYETLFKGPYAIIQTWKNVTVTLLTVSVTTRINIIRIKPYNNNTNTELISHMQ